MLGPTLTPLDFSLAAGALDIRASVGTSTSPTNSAPNLLTFTEDFSNAAWTKTGVTVTANDAVAPNGTTTADKLVFSGANQDIKQAVILSSQAATMSVWVKGTAGETIQLSNFINASNIHTLNGNWQRLTFTGTVGNPFAAITTYDGVTARTIWVWGAQLEVGSSATTYVAHPVINKAVTGVGFTPKVVLPFHASRQSDGVGSNDANLAFGIATSTSSRAAIGVESFNARTTSLTNRRHTASRAVTWVYNGTAVLEADLSSFDASGFTLNWSPALAEAYILNHICLGGADLEVSLTQQQMNGTNAAQSFAHGLSGAPTGVLFFGANTVSAPPNTSVDLFMSIGAWAGGNQFNAAVVSATAVTTTLTRRMLSTAGVMSLILNSNLRQMAVASVSATNVNVTYPITTTANTDYFWMLAIRGARCQVGTFDCNGSTSPLSINTPGITPKLFLPVFVVDYLALGAGAVLPHLLMTIGASDGTNSVSCGISDENGLTTTNARRYQSSTSLREYNLGGASMFQATAAFSGESVVVTPTTANAGYGKGGYLVIGS